MIKKDWFNAVFAPVITFIIIAIIGLGGSVWSAQAIIKERQDNVIIKLSQYEKDIHAIEDNINSIKTDLAECKLLLKAHTKDKEVATK